MYGPAFVTLPIVEFNVVKATEAAPLICISKSEGHVPDVVVTPLKDNTALVIVEPTGILNNPVNVLVVPAATFTFEPKVTTACPELAAGVTVKGAVVEPVQTFNGLIVVNGAGGMYASTTTVTLDVFDQQEVAASNADT